MVLRDHMKDIVRWRADGLTLGEIGARLHVTAERVRQVLLPIRVRTCRATGCERVLTNRRMRCDDCAARGCRATGKPLGRPPTVAIVVRDWFHRSANPWSSAQDVATGTGVTLVQARNVLLSHYGMFERNPNRRNSFRLRSAT